MRLLLFFVLVAFYVLEGYKAYAGKISWLSFAGLVALVIPTWYVGVSLSRCRVLEKIGDWYKLRRLLSRRHREAKAWMVANKPTKLELNAAIERLIETQGEDAEAGKLVAIFGYSLPSRRRRKEWARLRTKQPRSFSGFTLEMGNVNISGPSEISHSGKLLPYEQVGKFKIHRNQCRLSIRELWRSDLGPQSFERWFNNPEYIAILSQHELNIHAFGVIEREVISDTRTTKEHEVKIRRYALWIYGPWKDKRSSDGEATFTRTDW